jgi:hypothetical protein
MSILTPHDAYLREGAEHRPSDMHVRSGYPIWTLVSVWYARGQSDDAVIAEYALDSQEWVAAKSYYFAHQREIDARRTLNDEEPDVPIPDAVTIDEFLAEKPDADKA